MKVTTFNHEIFGELRTVTMPDGQIGFVGKDVARALGYTNATKAIIAHVEDEDKMDLYSCTSCGAEIIATKVSGTAKCPYCYNNLIFVKQFTGELKPDLIIPFKLEKEDAIKAYNKHLDSRKLFLPKVFKKQNHIDEIQGVYVPYWLFDAKFDFDYAYKCKKVEKWQKGPFDFVKNSKYDAYRDGTIAYINVPRDGSKRMNDLLMDSIEPFDISESQNFSTYYIAGHPAERYDVPFEDCINDAIKRMEQTTYDELNETLKGYEEKKAELASAPNKDDNYII